MPFTSVRWKLMTHRADRSSLSSHTPRHGHAREVLFIVAIPAPLPIGLIHIKPIQET